MSSSEAPTAQTLKDKGNECVKEGKYEEAILHYTHAIKLDPENCALYSNRSLAFFKIQQYYLALQDANHTIRTQPGWAKGYFRRGEIELATGLFDEAILSYGRALQIQPGDESIINAIKRVTQIKKKSVESDSNAIWLSTCVGFIIGIVIVILDQTITNRPTFSNPLLMVLFSLVISGAGFGVGKIIVQLRHWDISKGIQPPNNLESDNKENETEQPKKNHSKYSKAQARQRYKQGKN